MNRKLLGIVVVVATMASAFALEGTNGYTGARLFTIGEVKNDAQYLTGFGGSRWQDLSDVALWAPIGPGQRDGIAANDAGEVFFLVRGRDSSGSGPQYTGLVRYDGSGFMTLAQAEMSSPLYATRVGTELEAVTTSPSGSGLLTAGHPVVVRMEISRDGGVVDGGWDVVSVDPSTGAEIFIHRFGTWASEPRLAIDGSGTATDGTIYAGPFNDGRIARLTYSGGSYAETFLPGSFSAGGGITVDPDGSLYAFSSDSSWSGTPAADRSIYEIDPDTGAATVFAEVDPDTFVFDWQWDGDGTLWIALRDTARKGRHYVTDVPPGGTTRTRDRVSQSSRDAWSIAAGALGKIYVLERAFDPDGEAWELAPGAGDTGGSGGGGKGKGKKK